MESRRARDRAVVEAVVEGGDFHLVYQPIVHLDTGEVAGVEALCRFDAGAGWASFRHILSLRPDIIKMDRSLTRGVDVDPARRALAMALAIFAGEVGATVVAEGVETDGEVRALRLAGIHRGQGFILAPPQAPPIGAPAYAPVSLDALLSGPQA